jgi:hypothetical protein
LWRITGKALPETDPPAVYLLKGKVAMEYGVDKVGMIAEIVKKPFSVPLSGI